MEEFLLGAGASLECGLPLVTNEYFDLAANVAP